MGIMLFFGKCLYSMMSMLLLMIVYTYKQYENFFNVSTVAGLPVNQLTSKPVNQDVYVNVNVNGNENTQSHHAHVHENITNSYILMHGICIYYTVLFIESLGYKCNYILTFLYKSESSSEGGFIKALL